MFTYKWPKAAFVAGDSVLDFLNTVDFRGRTRNQSRLTGYSSVLTWGLAAGIIDEAEFREISSIAMNAPFDAERALADLLHWREATYRAFAAISQKEEPSLEDWSTIEVSIQTAISSASLCRIEVGRARWRGFSGRLELKTIGQRLALRMNEFLNDDLVAKIKQCEGCTWLFVDTSKNNKRRWCSMATCGNRAKAQRHYQTKGLEEGQASAEGLMFANQLL